MIHIIGATANNLKKDDFLKKIQQWGQHHTVSVQAMNAKLIFGRLHLQSAAEHAIRAFQQGTNTAHSLSTETLLYAAGERQITLAIDKMGVQPTSKEIALVIIDNLKGTKEASGSIQEEDIMFLLKQLNLERDDNVLISDENMLPTFGITQEERKTVSKAKYEQLILEKVALVDFIK